MSEIPKNVSDSLAANQTFVDTTGSYKTIKDDLAKKYADSDFQYQEKKAVSNLWDELKAWLARVLNDLFDFDSQKSLENAVDTLINTVGLILLAIVIYIVVRAVIKHKGNWFFENKETDFQFDFATSVEATEENLEQLLVQFKKEENYRFASRVIYLLTIKKLAAAGSIIYDADKTNIDFRRQIKNTQIRSFFDHIVYVFENVWYGEKELKNIDFSEMEKSFNLLNKRLNG
ncbi:hypothetical protein [Flavobacterium sp.]|uniref:hypothetical protein n=1 Tax=Flavobacterium sp. TaxID=239 RepID=UPI003B9ACAD0